MMFFLYGKEDFLSSRKVDELSRSFRLKNPTALSRVFDFEEEVEIKELIACFHQGGGIFSQKLFIVIKHVFQEAAELQTKIHKLLESYALGNTEVIVVVIEKEIKNKRSSLFKFLEKNAKGQEFKKMDYPAEKKWLVSEIRKRSQGKLDIVSVAQERLLNLAGGSLWKLNSEIEKLVNFKDEGKIELTDINLICSGEVEGKIFDLVDAISQKDKASSCKIMSLLAAQGVNDFYVFSMVVYQFRSLIKIFDLKARVGPNPGLISQELKIHPFVAKKALRQLARYSKGKLRQHYQLLAKIDSEVKSGTRDMSQALVYFIIQG